MNGESAADPTVIVAFVPAPPRPAVAIATADGSIASAPVRIAEESVVLSTDPVRTRDIALSLWLLEGRDALADVADQLPAPHVGVESAVRFPTAPERVALAWEVACGAVDEAIARWLVVLEDRATSIALRRLRDSRSDVLRERDRYLPGGPATDVRNDRRLSFKGGKLAREAELRQFLREVAELRQRVRFAREQVERTLVEHPPYRPPDAEEIAKTQREYLHQQETLQRYLRDTGPDSPLLPWLVEWDKDPVVDEARAGGATGELEDRVRHALRACWEASWTVQDRMGAMPARTGQRGRAAPELALAELLDDEDAAGPWRFQSVVAAARDELGWARESPQATAADRVFAAAGPDWAQALGFAGGTLVAMMVVHAFCPPAAIVFDVALASWGAATELHDLHVRSIEYRAVLDQRQSLVMPPDARAAIAALIGLATARLGGLDAFVYGLLVPIGVQAFPTGAPGNVPSP